MNSKQRRKMKRRFKYIVPVTRPVRLRLELSHTHGDILDWLESETIGDYKPNWFSQTIRFEYEKDAVMFRMKF